MHDDDRRLDVGGRPNYSVSLVDGLQSVVFGAEVSDSLVEVSPS